MPIEMLLTFSAALLVAAAIPGPGVLALIARALGSGFWATVPMVIGLALGDLIFLAMAVLGLAALAEALGGLFLAVKLAGAAYLVYLGWRLWRTADLGANVVARTAARPGRMLLAGFLVTMGNPKTMVFYLALVPAFLDMGAIDAVGFIQLCLAAMTVLSLVLFCYVAAAARVRRLITDSRLMRRLNRGAGAVMICGGVGVAAS